MPLSEFAKFIIQNKPEFLGVLFLPAIAGFCFGYIIWLAASDPLKTKVFTRGTLAAVITGTVLTVTICVFWSYIATSNAKTIADKLNNDGYVLYENGQKTEKADKSIKEIMDIMGDVTQDIIVDDQHKQVLVSSAVEDETREKINEYWDKYGSPEDCNE